MATTIPNEDEVLAKIKAGSEGVTALRHFFSTYLPSNTAAVKECDALTAKVPELIRAILLGEVERRVANVRSVDQAQGILRAMEKTR